ncbi:MAG: DUF4416 family protein [Halobacteriovoraceae bacterium]|nr:DUF4416 family protein [Halobacteriovoraceae bacterium]MCB9093888.1 DUF4416 family protein [Halobacteriovoraceae bacterium]
MSDISELVELQFFQDYDILKPTYNPSLTYYSKEMGTLESLDRVIFGSLKPLDRDQFVDWKVKATFIEEKTAVNGNRIINIDVGFLSLEQMILATGKPYAHRLYLAKGVYADLQYIYKKGKFEFLAWTYPDYQHEEKQHFFKELRSKLLSYDKTKFLGYHKNP